MHPHTVHLCISGTAPRKHTTLVILFHIFHGGFPGTIHDLPVSSCISSTSNGITLLILRDTTLVILFDVYPVLSYPPLHQLHTAQRITLVILFLAFSRPTRSTLTVFLRVLMFFYGVFARLPYNFYKLSCLSPFLPSFAILRRHTSTFVLYMRRKAPAPAVS